MSIDQAKYWRFKAETKRHIAELRKKLNDVSVNGGGGSGGGGGTDIDLSDYATMRWVESQGYVKSADLSGYALTSQIPTKVSQLTNDANYLKSSSTPLAFSVYALNVRSSLSLRAYSSSAPDDAPDIGFFSYSNEEIGRIYKPAGIERFYVRFGADKPSYSLAFTSDLSEYAKRTEIPSLTGYATQDWVNGALSDYALAGDIPSLTGYATETWVNGKLSDYALTSQIPTNNNQLANGAGYITAAALQPYAKTADLSKFALKTEIPTQLSQLTDDVGYALTTQIPTNNNQLSNGAGYVTATQLNSYGYATEAWVNNQLTNKIPTNNSQLSNGEGYIKGIDSAMVIEALNYTPFNAVNFTKANIKNTLGIADWALGSTKPSYSWSEIQSRPTALSQFSNDVGYITASAKVSSASSADESNKLLAQYLAKSDANTLGIGAVFGWVNTSTGASNIPTAGNLISFEDNSRCATQILSKYDGTATYTRIKKQSDKTWSDWVQLAYKSHIPTRLSQLTDDMVAGYYLANTGGTLSGKLTISSAGGNNQLTINNTAGGEVYMYLSSGGVNSGALTSSHPSYGTCLFNQASYQYLGISDAGVAHLTGQPLLHSGNFHNYAVPLTGGAMSGALSVPSITIGGVTISAQNGAITINGSLLATGDITGGV